MGRYGEDWQYKPVPGKDGKKPRREMVYIGKYYTLDMEDTRRKPMKRNYLIFSLISVALLLGIGFLNPPGSHIGYVLLPYGLSMLFGMLVLQSTIEILFTKRLMTRETSDHAFHRARKMTAFAFAAILFTAVGEIAVIIQGFSIGLQVTEYLFLAGCIITAVILWFFMQWQGKITDTIKETNEKPE